MDVILDTPAHIRHEQLRLWHELKHITNKVVAQSLVRHPQDWEHLSDRLEQAANDLDALIEQIKQLPHNQR